MFRFALLTVALTVGSAYLVSTNAIGPTVCQAVAYLVSIVQ
jgi:hypothetical protein